MAMTSNNDLLDLVQVIGSRFRSGNGIPVELAYVTRGEWSALFMLVTAAVVAPSNVSGSQGDPAQHQDTDGKTDIDQTLALNAALIAGDRWLSADACAVFLGMVTPSGRPNRRGFLERVACRPDFPRSNPITRSWKKSEVDDWAMEHRRFASKGGS